MVDNSILSTKYIYKALGNSTELTSLVDKDNIFPLLAKVRVNPKTGKEEDIKFPFIVYSRTSLTPIYTKDILTDNEITIQIVCVSDDYTNSLDVANAVRHALEGKNAKVDGITISRIKLISVLESTYEDAYIQTLTFRYNTI